MDYALYFVSLKVTCHEIDDTDGVLVRRVIFILFSVGITFPLTFDVTDDVSSATDSAGVSVDGDVLW